MVTKHIDKMTDDEVCEAVVNGERCKHNMVFEYCGVCQEASHIDDIQFPVVLKDEDGEPKLDRDGAERKIWLRREVKRTSYYRYR